MAHKYPPWRRVILVPFWTLQIFLMLIIIGLLVAARQILLDQYDSSIDYSWGSYSDSDVESALKAATNVVVPVWSSLSAACILIVITEIVFLTRRKLTPAKFVVLNVVKSTIWTGLFILDIVAWATSTGRRETVVGIVLDLGIVLSFWLPLIYGSIVLHKQRKEKKSYNPINHPEGHDTTYHSQLHPQNQHVESGPPPYAGQISGTTEPAYDPYKPAPKPMYYNNNHGDVGLAHPSPGLMSPAVPQVFVQHHDNVYEMDTRRNLS